MKKSAQAKPAGSSENQKPLEAYTSKAFDRLVAKSGHDQKAVDEVIKEVAKSFGNPHVHSGLDIRDLRETKGIYECRVALGGRGGLEVRLVFKKMKGKPKTLLFDFIGDHNGVQRYLKRVK